MMSLERESSAAHWTRQHYDDLFLPRADRNAPERHAWVAEADPKPQSQKNLETRIRGFIIACKIRDEYELENLVVGTESRRQGIGRLLVNQLLAHSRENHASGIFLEVRESNRAARELYEEFGFKIAGLRRSYYQAPPEDAVLYRLNLC
jgi:ribosomal-protein-alanine acetyltransferase